AVDPVALANESLARLHAAQLHVRDPALDRKISRVDHLELVHETLKLDQPVETHRKQHEMQNEHGIKIVEIAVEAEQHVADEREDPERDHGAHAEGGKQTLAAARSPED